MKRRTLSPMARLKVWEANKGTCHLCGQRVHVGEAWDVSHDRPLALLGEDGGDNLKVAHRACHKERTVEDFGRIAKAKRQRAAHVGAKQRGWQSKWKRKLDGSVVLR